MNTLVVIPTYNERDALPGTIERLFSAAPYAEVLVVDDGSPDGTGQIVDSLARRDPRMHVLHRDRKGGLGGAYRAGFEWGLSRSYDRLVEMDADGSHDPAELPSLLDALDRADVAIGSRWVPGGSIIGWPVHRLLLSRGGSAYARIALRLRQRDVTSGYRAFRAPALRALDPASLDSQGYSFQIEVLWRANLAKLEIVEVPIAFTERVLGRSKMSTRIVAEAMLRVTAWAVRGGRVPRIETAPIETAAHA